MKNTQKVRAPLTYFSNLTEKEKSSTIEQVKTPIMQGQLLDLAPRKKTPKTERIEIENPTRGDRRASLSFSGSSAKTLSRLLASLDFTGGIFLTLTQQPGKTPQQAKKALDNFFKQLNRDKPATSGIWRMEKQKNGSPHFHVLVFGIELLDLFHWNPHANWKNQIGVEVDPRAIDMQTVATNTGAFLYLVGHGTKKNQTWDGKAVGRYWGKYNKKNLPFAQEHEVNFLPGEKEFLQRYWERSEQRRVDWLAKKYPGKTYEPRSWEYSGPLKLYARPVWKILKVWRLVKRWSLQENTIHEKTGKPETQYLLDF